MTAIDPRYYTREQLAAVAPTKADWDDWWNTVDPDAWECDQCGGDGYVEYNDAPETWGEDCPSQRNHLVACPGCAGAQRDREFAVRTMILKRRGVEPAGISEPPGISPRRTADA